MNQTCWVYCPGCRCELTRDPHAEYLDSQGQVTYACQCGRVSQWLFDAPVPVLLHEDPPMPPTLDSRFDRSLEFVLRWEGGWANDEADHGGATACGITLATARRHPELGILTADELKFISPEQVRAIYLTDYWDQVCALTPWPLCLAYFDTAVNSGQKRAIKCLQVGLGVEADGVAGPVTRQALAEAGAGDKASIVELSLSLCAAREAFLRAIAVGDQVRFLKGWTRRVDDLRRVCREPE